MDPAPSPKYSSPPSAASRADSASRGTVPVKTGPPKVPPLFRPVDWLALIICFAIVQAIYVSTLAPQVTLEDSGELLTGSYYAGIPHPPGYPFWAIYSWLWTRLWPFGNIAWRVELGQAAAMGMGCSLIAFMVSRGSSMLIEGIDDLKGIARKWENAICLVCGVTAGLLMALDIAMWGESVAINRISEFGVPWLILVLLCMMRWIYAPHQRGYLYCAFFFFGICATIHQTLIVAAMGLEIGIACTNPKLGRDLLCWNGVVWAAVYGAAKSGIWTSFSQSNPTVFTIFNTIGICSIVAGIALSIKPRWRDKTWSIKDKIIAAVSTLLVLLVLWQVNSLLSATGGPSQGGALVIAALLIAAAWGLRLWTESLTCLFMGLLWLAGASFYFYEAISGMTNPPMEWGYPRTVEGFFHALTRGQYDKMSPTNIIADPMMFVVQLKLLAKGIAEAFNWVYMFFALLPFLFFFKMKRREKNWIVTVAAVYPFLGVLLTIFLNPQKDRQSVELLRVFFAASHGIVAILIGYGLALTAAYMVAQYERFRRWGVVGGVAAFVGACYCLLLATGELYFGQDGEVPLGSLGHWIAQAFAPSQYGLPVFANLILILLPLIFLAALAVHREKAPLLILLGVFAAMPLTSGLAHWFHSEQRGHWFGYWYGHDMFSPPVTGPDGKLTYDTAVREKALAGTNASLTYPEMARDAVVYGGTDPGRFCPTYMIFCESFIPHDCQPEQDQHFDRRDCYLITQNAVADPTYLDYIRAQYNDSAQTNSPFFQNLLPGVMPARFHEPTKALVWLDDVFETIGASVERERRTRTSWFKPEDFRDPAKMAARLRPHAGQDELSKYLFQHLSKETQTVVGGTETAPVVSRALTRDFNVILSNGPTGKTIYSPALFEGIKLPVLIQKAVQLDQTSNLVVRLNRRLLEEAYSGEIAKSLGGVYPDTEIHTASFEDLRVCEEAYTHDAALRYQHDHEHPTEPHQLKPGEDVVADNSGRLSFGGLLVVMGINAYVTKDMFDANPDHEFYVEESYPMDWMYPNLMPFGVIMKVNRQPVELTEADLMRDHEFWSQYSTRLIGNWITYDTPVKDICDFAEKVFLRHDYTGYTGDLKFMRDDDAQKGFSKLRSAIATSIYQYRGNSSRQPAQRARLLKEADFALKQAFAYCPYSEGASKYAQLLLEAGRNEDALLVVRTFQKLDPFNRQVQGMLLELLVNTGKRDEALATAKHLLEFDPDNPQMENILGQLQNSNKAGPTTVSVQEVFAQIDSMIAAGRNADASTLLDRIMQNPPPNALLLMQVAQRYAQLRDLTKAEQAIVRSTEVEPNVSETWYNLANVRAFQGHTADAVDALKKALSANALERASNPNFMDLRENARTNPMFNAIRATPEFRAVVPN